MKYLYVHNNYCICTFSDCVISTFTAGNFPNNVSSSAVGENYQNYVDWRLVFEQDASDVTTLEFEENFVLENQNVCGFDALEVNIVFYRT